MADVMPVLVARSIGRPLSSARIAAIWLCCRAAIDRPVPRRWFAFATTATRSLYETAFAKGDVLVFGRESAGLPDEVLDTFPAERRLRIPMRPGVRSLNLSNAVAVAVYEAWRQNGFAGASGREGDP